jgi:serine/threonine protein kinase
LLFILEIDFKKWHNLDDKIGEKMAERLRFKDYKIVSEAGKGAVAVTYLAIQEKLKRKVAIKVMEEPTLLKNEKVFERFLREAETAAGLSHSNIIQIIDTGKMNKYYYIVMEYLEESLRERMIRESEGKIPPESALEIVEGIMRALDYIHLQGIYHRDIKPDNIMFRKDNTPVLLDFGIARVLDQLITEAMKSMGTTYYMSPEQCRGDDIDGRSDVYSLGVVLFEMLTGERPYKGKTPGLVISQHLNDPVPRLPEALRQYQPLIDNMMAKDREKRISSTPEFHGLLKTIGIALRIFTSPSEETFPLPTPGKTARKPITVFPLREEAPSLRQKVTDSFESFAIKCLDLLTGKVLPFLRDMKKKWSAFLDKKFEKLNPRMNKPIVKKLVLVYFPAVVILAVILIIIFSQGSQSPTNQSTQSEITLPFFGEIFKQAPQYQKLWQAQELFKKDDLKSLNKADGLIKKLKKILIIPEVTELEEKITNRINMLNLEFQRDFDAVTEHIKNKNYKKAKEYISKAKQIKPNDKDILDLGKIIEEAIKNGEEKKK